MLNNNVISIELIDAKENVREHCEGNGHCELVWYGSYEPGDMIRVQAVQGSFVRLQIDQLISPASLYFDEGTFLFPIPFGSAKDPYPFSAFTGIHHQLSAFYFEKPEGTGLLSENPLDVRGDCGVYPHCSASIETRGEAVFAARNTIDGLLITPGHGIWPYSSWGCGRDTTAHIDLWFGRPVWVEEVQLFLRADFPHDNYWKEGRLTFGDDFETTVSMTKTGECQTVWRGEPVLCDHVRLSHLILDEKEPGLFASLTQWRIWGREEF